MHWRAEKGERWDDLKGEEAKQRFRRLVEEAKQRFRRLVQEGKAHGVLAFCNGEPIGWVSFDKRTDYARLDRAPSLQCEDAERVWSIPCFFVKPGYRKQGVAGVLLKAALKALKKKKAGVVEGYPVRPKGDGKPFPAAFAWTGTLSLFEKAGFDIVQERERGKQRMRKWM
jgi:GNAT superfamily N-acetyltransferase